MKRILTSLPFLFIFGLIIWTFNSIIASMFAPGRLSLDASLFSTSVDNIYFRVVILFFSVFLYMILFRIFVYEKDEKLLRKALNHSFPMCITDFDGNIIEMNKSYQDIFNASDSENRKIKCYESRPGNACHTDLCPLVQVKNGQNEITCEHAIESNGGLRHYDIKVKSLRNSFDEVIGMIETFNDITDRVLLLSHNRKLIDELQESLDHVKLLSGMLPVCTSCKQVRSDKGYWEQIESYLGDNSEVEVVTSLCPDCKEISSIIVEDFDDTEQSELRLAEMSDMQWLKIAN